jgi:DNA-binding LacI/PurR family transcriptional regulator
VAEGRRRTLVDVKRGVTSYDVAVRAGVSQSAVSRCFKPGASVAPATRARIMAAAEALGYAPNAIAQGLITRRSNLVGVLISNLTNLNYPEVLSELTRRFSERDVRVLLFTLQTESDVPQALTQLWRYRVDGVVAAARLEPAAIAQFGARGVPLVLYNRDGEGAAVSSVCCDSRAGERLLVDRLAQAGRRCFGVITGPADSHVSQERVHGATERLRELGLSFEVADGAFDYASGGVGVRRLMMATDNRLDALICANDVMAIGAVDAARHSLGLRVPEDLSVVGFDGVGPARWASYNLTTVRQPVHRMTESAVAMLLERIERPELTPERRLFAGELITGGSARINDD